MFLIVFINFDILAIDFFIISYLILFHSICKNFYKRIFNFEYLLFLNLFL